MSKPHHGYYPLFSGRNPFKNLFNPKICSVCSPEDRILRTTFELSLASRLQKLNRNGSVGEDFLSFDWMITAMESLCETHKAIQTLITELEFPVTDWDKRWVELYFDESVKLLDICNGFSSELSQLDRSRLLLKYAICVLNKKNVLDEQTKTSLCEWKTTRQDKKKNLETSSSILQELAGSLALAKVKNSSKGDVLMRAMYGVKAHTVFICTIFAVILSGKPDLFLNLTLPTAPVTFLWLDAFEKLQVNVSRQIQARCLASSMILKELHLVDQSISKLTDLITEPNTVSDFGENVVRFTDGVDSLSNQVGDFFGILLAGRDALIFSLRALLIGKN
ncbi:hypothetical protein ZOSMA_76G00510 [Zostera marina]|uniref:Protein BPS1, chloroplastic n=1 Tax=Zostera marina TaxID=29655 RepID=A0A0K9NR80_ZOSMR|nr:hypothetical protein ZOSMA_76G00510 [Zostera marina]